MARGLQVRITAVLAVVAVVALAVLLARSHPGEVLDHLTDAPASGLVTVVGLVLVAYVLRFAKWHLFLHRLGLGVPLGLSASVFCAGLLMVATPAKVGEVWKALALNEARAIPVGRSLPAVALERLTDLVAVGALALLAAAVFGFAPLLAALAIAALLAGVLVLRWRRPWLWGIGRLQARWPEARAPAFLRSLYDGTHSLLAPAPLAFGGLIGLVAWALEGLALAVLLSSLGHPVAALWAVGVFCAGTLAGVLSILPGGVGTAEAGMAGLLVAGGVPADIALAATILVRIFTLGFGVAVGALSYVVWWRPSRRAT